MPVTYIRRGLLASGFEFRCVLAVLLLLSLPVLKDSIASGSVLQSEVTDSLTENLCTRFSHHATRITEEEQERVESECKENQNKLSTVLSWIFHDMLYIKGLFHPKMKISPCFTRSQSIIYDFLLSDESKQSYIKNCPGPSKRYNGDKRVVFIQSRSREIKFAHL